MQIICFCLQDRPLKLTKFIGGIFEVGNHKENMLVRKQSIFSSFVYSVLSIIQVQEFSRNYWKEICYKKKKK